MSICPPLFLLMYRECFVWTLIPRIMVYLAHSYESGMWFCEHLASAHVFVLDDSLL